MVETMVGYIILLKLIYLVTTTIYSTMVGFIVGSMVLCVYGGNKTYGMERLFYLVTAKVCNIMGSVYGKCMVVGIIVLNYFLISYSPIL